MKPDTGSVEGKNQYGVAGDPEGTTIPDSLGGQADATVGLAANARGLGWREKGEDKDEFRKRKGLQQARVDHFLVDPAPAAATTDAI